MRHGWHAAALLAVVLWGAAPARAQGDEGATPDAEASEGETTGDSGGWAPLDEVSLRLGTSFWSREDRGNGLKGDGDEVRLALQLNAWLGFDQQIMIGGMLSYDFTFGFGGDFKSRGPGFSNSVDIDGLGHNLDVGPCLPIRLRHVTIYPFVAYNYHSESLDSSSALGSQDETFSSHGATFGARIAANMGLVGFELVGRYTLLLEGELDVDATGLGFPTLETDGDMIRIDPAVWLYLIPDSLSISLGGGIVIKGIDAAREQIGAISFESAKQEVLQGTVRVGVHLVF